MFAVFEITAPLFALIALGWGATRAGLFDAAQLRVLGRYVLLLALPMLLFTAVSKRNVAEVLDARYALGYALRSLVAFAVAYAWARWRRGAPGTLAAMQGLGASTSNSGYLGLPIAMQVLDSAAGGPIAVAFLVENLITIPLGLALADAAQSAAKVRASATVSTQGDGPPRAAGGGTAQGVQRVLAAVMRTVLGAWRNPLLMAVLLGMAFSLTGWVLPTILQRPVSMVAASATPVALFVIGGTLVGLKTQGMRLDVARMAGFKLLVHPAAVGAVLWLLMPQQPGMVQAGVLMAAMPMVGVFSLLAQRYQHEGFAAATVMVTTTVSFLTINALLVWMR